MSGTAWTRRVDVVEDGVCSAKWTVVSWGGGKGGEWDNHTTI